MTEPDQVRVAIEERAGGLLATVTIDNAARANSLNSALMEQFAAALAGLAIEERLRAVVLASTGPGAFIAGADIKEMAAVADSGAARAFITRVHRCCDAVRTVPVPVIARIQGATFGAGLELAAACDVRVASTAAVFGMPEVRLGIPSVVEAALLPMLIGWGRTRQLLLCGESLDAATAQDWGLIEQLVEPDALDGKVAALVDQVMAGTPRAVRLQKQLIRSWEDLPVRAAIATGIDCFASAYTTAEPATAMRRFLEHRARPKPG